MLSKDLRPQDLFACTMCGDCCKGYGGTYVSREDIAAIAAFLQADLPDVVRQYCRFSGGKYLLEQGTDDYCVFWNKACTIHPVKPRMCRKWPFIESVVVDPFNWLIMAGSCAGMRTDVSLRQVRKCVKRFLSGSEPASKR